MGTELIRRHCRLESSAQKLPDSAFEKLTHSAGAVTRILEVARTFAQSGLKGTLLHEIPLDRIADELSVVLHAHLLQDACAIGTDGLDTQLQLLADFGNGLA